MIDSNREEFEKLPEIAGRLKAKGIWYNEQINQYTIVCFKEDQERINAVFFVGGAWYAFQEQQKIINMQECGVRQILEVLNDENLFYENKCDTIKELLK